MKQKNTTDLPTEFSSIMEICADSNMSVQNAKRMLRRALRIMATEMPARYCKNTAKYPILITQDYS